MIKKSDKGSNLVTQNVDDYIKECLRQLGDEKFYKKLDYDPTEEFRKKIHKELECMFADKEISEKTFFSWSKEAKEEVYSICFLTLYYVQRYRFMLVQECKSKNKHTVMYLSDIKSSVEMPLSSVEMPLPSVKMHQDATM